MQQLSYVDGCLVLTIHFKGIAETIRSFSFKSRHERTMIEANLTSFDSGSN